MNMNIIRVCLGLILAITLNSCKPQEGGKTQEQQFTKCSGTGNCCCDDHGLWRDNNGEMTKTIDGNLVRCSSPEQNCPSTDYPGELCKHLLLSGEKPNTPEQQACIKYVRDPSYPEGRCDGRRIALNNLMWPTATIITIGNTSDIPSSNIMMEGKYDCNGKRISIEMRFVLQP